MSDLHDLPLTGSDLRSIADVADLIDRIDANPATSPFRSPLVGRIEIMRPDDDSGEVIGHMAPSSDGEWYGFVPS